MSLLNQAKRLLIIAAICVTSCSAASTIYTDAASFVAAVGSQSLGQQNFSGYVAQYGSSAVLTASGAAYTGISGSPFSVVSQGPFDGPALMDSGAANSGVTVTFSSPTYYFGFYYHFVDAGGTKVIVTDNTSYALSQSGFWGIISTTPIPVSGGLGGTFTVEAGDLYIDNVLYAQGPGISADNPLLPSSESCVSSGQNGAECIFDFVMFAVFEFVDPTVANAYTYQTLNGEHFTSVSGFPSGFAGPFNVSSGGADYGHFSPGQTLVFANPVSTFTVSGINPAVDGSSPTAFPIQVGVDTVGAQIELTAFFAASLDTVGPITSNVAVSPNPVAVNTTSMVGATVDDSTTGGSNIVSAYYTINGGTSSQMSLIPSSAVTTQASATLPPFLQPNVYNVCVHGTDSAGNTGADSCSILPVYDPNGSFVTGSGQIASPAGADLLNPSGVGQATFGFVSKYLPGRNTPSGNMEFQFKQGNLDFKSTSMDWLVVTGELRAKFHGTGTVNGSSACAFEVDAWAGSFPGNVDAFGLKISSCSNGGDRYTLPATTLTKGSIVIH